MTLKKQVLEQIWPPDEERDKAEEKFHEIKEYIKEAHGVKAELMGSLAKGTFISGDKDLDIFVFFPEDISEDELEEKGLHIGKDVFEHFGGDYRVEYAEHPYTKGYLDGFEVEIVPAYSINSPEEMKSSVDRTPLHKKWVNGKLSEEEKKEVVLLKQFLKGTGLYGSTLKQEGFSGYLCELLIAHYKGFRELLKDAVNWDEEEVLDPGGHHQGGLPEKLEDQFRNENLVVIDPVDPERNVASVLSKYKYSKFIYQAFEYLEDPAKEFFFPEDPNIDIEKIEDEMEARGEMLVVEFSRPEVVEDILYPQLRKLMRRVKNLLNKHEFELFDSGFWVDENHIRLVFDFQNFDLPKKIKHMGPQVFHNRENLKDFRDKYQNVWVEGSRLTTLVEREYRNAENFLKEFFTGDLREKGVPQNLAETAEDRKIRSPELEGEKWLSFLTQFLHLDGQ